MIYETIVITTNADGSAHIVPLGIRRQQDKIVLAPFRPSGTLDNLRQSRCAVVNYTTDVCVFAGCLTGRYQWPLRAAEKINGYVLVQTLSHSELEIIDIEDDPLRPRFLCQEIHCANHAPFQGFNRAQAAVIEAAILVSRLHMLPAQKIDQEMQYLSIAIEKTAGAQELQAWGWLVEKIDQFRAEQSASR